MGETRLRINSSRQGGDDPNYAGTSRWREGRGRGPVDELPRAA